MISDMHCRVTYMYINFQQIRVPHVRGTVKTVLTNIFANNCKLHKNLQLPIVILEKKTILLDVRHRETYMYINFSKIGLIDQS